VKSRSGWVVFLQAVQSFGHLSFRLRWLCRPLKRNTSRCRNLCATFSPSCSSFRKWRRKVFKSFAHSTMFIAKFLRTILVL
jgi:hypothetical protein